MSCYEEDDHIYARLDLSSPAAQDALRWYCHLARKTGEDPEGVDGLRMVLCALTGDTSNDQPARVPYDAELEESGYFVPDEWHPE